MKTFFAWLRNLFLVILETGIVWFAGIQQLPGWINFWPWFVAYRTGWAILAVLISALVVWASIAGADHLEGGAGAKMARAFTPRNLATMWFWRSIHMAQVAALIYFGQHYLAVVQTVFHVSAWTMFAMIKHMVAKAITAS